MSKSKECANPLFERWLVEWKGDYEELARGGSTSDKNKAHAIGKALKGLRDYPNTLDLSTYKKGTVSGIGTKIKERLEERYAKYLREGGIPISEQQNSQESTLETTVTLKKKTRQRKTPIEGEVGEETVAKKKKKNKNNLESLKATEEKKIKNYIPAFRSGGYAILIVLIEELEEGRESVSKEILIKNGEAYCNASFTVPVNNYTAWSSMKTLLEKRLVLKHGNPHRYSLTEEGEKIARVEIEKLKKTEESVEVVVNSNCDLNVVNNFDSDWHPRPLESKHSELNCDVEDESNFFVFDYIDFDCNKSNSCNEAFIEFEESTGDILYKIKFDKYQIKKKLFKKVRRVEKLNEEYYLGYLCYEDVLSLKKIKSIIKSQPKKDLKKSIVSNNAPDTLRPSVTNFNQAEVQTNFSNPRSGLVLPNTAFTDNIMFENMKAGNFEIILALDNRETGGLKNRTHFQNTFAKHNLNVIQLALPIGDFAWVAESKDDPSKRFFLDFIVERKAGADFVSSVTDTRLEEQK
ncbi:Crossover junction endonuclease mus81, partial [Clydaea vesicula]